MTPQFRQAERDAERTAGVPRDRWRSRKMSRRRSHGSRFEQAALHDGLGVFTMLSDAARSSERGAHQQRTRSPEIHGVP
jgi:hypothetical protein